MTACAMCGHDADAPVTARWTFFVPLEPPSQNEIALRGGRDAKIRYRKLRDQFTLLIRSKMTQLGIPDASGRRRVVFTRIYCGRAQRRDRINNAGGMKMALDACSRAALLVDDAEEWVEDHYQQRRSDVLSGLEIEVSELAPSSAKKDTAP